MAEFSGDTRTARAISEAFCVITGLSSARDWEDDSRWRWERGSQGPHRGKIRSVGSFILTNLFFLIIYNEAIVHCAVCMIYFGKVMKSGE